MKLTYQILGEGQKTIVLLHYFGGNAESWQWVVKRLRKQFRLVLITLPGFGTTEPLPEPSIYNHSKYINDCIDDADLSDYVLCGHSMSAKLILYATQLNEDHRPKGLILVAPSPPTQEKMSKEEKVRMLDHPNEEQAKITVTNSTVKKLGKKRFDLAVKSQLETDHGTWTWWIEEGMNNDISDRVQGIECPTFIICAKKDPVIPMDAIYNEVMPYLHEPRLIQLGGCGHLIPLESPRKLSKRIRKIANRILTSS